MDRIELLMREYETITTQIVHWDTFFWHKSQFFLAIESVSLGLIVQRLSIEIVDNMPMHPNLFLMFVAVALFNFFLCYVWFRTNRRNREYLDVRFKRALQIENEPGIIDVVQLYRFQQATLKNPKYTKHSSSPWEIYLPIAFILAWFVSLIGAAFDSKCLVNEVIVILAIVLVVGAIIEMTGWPVPIREKI